MQTPSKSQLIYLHSALERQAGTLHPSTYDMILFIVFQYYFSLIRILHIYTFLIEQLVWFQNKPNIYNHLAITLNPF